MCRALPSPTRSMRSSLPRHHRAAAAAVAAALVVLATPLAAQQPGGPGAPPPPQNLKVLPKDISRDSLISTMRGIATGLGVRCEYCHVGEPPRFEFAKDDKQTKEKARFMLRMVDSLNHVVLAALPDRKGVVIQCVTCHRGSPVPQTLTTALTAAVDSFGIDTAIARYTRWRAQAETGRLDVSEQAVSDVARVLAGRGKTAEAIALQEMNEKNYPSSPDIDFALGELHRQRGERDAAITEYRMVLQKRPDDRRAAARLKELGAP